jgi:adenosylmethionine-8-amino-7-oxononanoate aminotransferase
MSAYVGGEVPVIVRGSGQYVRPEGKRYLDGLVGLFVSQIGHGRKEVAGRARSGAASYFPHAHPRAIELAERLATWPPAT